MIKKPYRGSEEIWPIGRILPYQVSALDEQTKMAKS